MRTRAGGFTLVEIMITLTLGLLLMTAAIGYYIANVQARTMNDASSALQDAARIAFDVMARDIRSAGDFGCVNSSLLNGASSYFDVNAPLIGYGNGTGAATATASLSLPLGSANVNTALGLGTYLSDVLVVSGTSGALTRVATAAASPIPLSASGFAVSDYVVISDCQSSATLFQVTAVDSATGALTPNVTLTSPIPAAGQELARIDAVWYAIAQPPNFPLGLYRYAAAQGSVTLISPLFFGHAAAGNTPALLAVSPYAPGLVLQYGFDIDNDGIIDCTLSASNMSSTCTGSASGVSASPSWNQVRSVVINVLLMSSSDHVLKSPMDFTFNGVSYPASSRPQDFHLYLPFSETVLLRNPPSSS